MGRREIGCGTLDNVSGGERDDRSQAEYKLVEGVQMQDDQSVWFQMNQREGKSTTSNKNKRVGSARLGKIDDVWERGLCLCWWSCRRCRRGCPGREAGCRAIPNRRKVRCTGVSLQRPVNMRLSEIHAAAA